MKTTMGDLNMLKKRKIDELENCVRSSDDSLACKGIHKKLLNCLTLLTKHIIDVQKSKSEPLKYDTKTVIKRENDSSCDIDITEHNIALPSECSLSSINTLANHVSVLKQHITKLESTYNMPMNTTLNDPCNYTSIDSSCHALVLQHLSDYSVNITEQVSNLIYMYKSEQPPECAKNIRKRLSKITKHMKQIPLQAGTVKNNTNVNKSNNEEVDQLSKNLAILIKRVSKVRKVYKKRVLNTCFNKSVNTVVDINGKTNVSEGNCEPPVKKKKENSSAELTVAIASDSIKKELNNVDNIAKPTKKKRKKDKTPNQTTDESNGKIKESESIDLANENNLKSPGKKRKSKKSKMNGDNSVSNENGTDNVCSTTDASLRVTDTGKSKHKVKDRNDTGEHFSKSELSGADKQNKSINSQVKAGDTENIENSKQGKHKKKKSKTTINVVNDEIEISQKIIEVKKESVQNNHIEDIELETPKKKFKQNVVHIEKQAIPSGHEKLTNVENTENEQMKQKRKILKNKTNLEHITNETEMSSNEQVAKKKHKDNSGEKSMKIFVEEILHGLSGGLNAVENNENGSELATHQSPKKKHKKRDKSDENMETVQIKKVLVHGEINENRTELNSEQSEKKKHKHKNKTVESNTKEMTEDLNKNDGSNVEMSMQQAGNKNSQKINNKSGAVLEKASPQKEELLGNETSLLGNTTGNAVDNHVRIFTVEEAWTPQVKLEVCEDEDEDFGLCCEFMQDENLDEKERFLYLEEHLETIKEKQELSEETKSQLRGLKVLLNFEVPESHTIENRISYGPSREQDAKLKDLGVKSGRITKDEDKIIRRNWESFCQLHDFPGDPRPFLALQHGHEKLIPFEERKKFVQYLGRDLAHRALHTIYRRFKLLYSDMKTGRFNEEEDKLILAYVNRANKNAKFAALAPVLHRSRLSIEARYRTLKLGQTETIRWSLELKAELIKHLMDVTNVEDVLGLREADIKYEHYMEVAHRMKLPALKIRMQWCTKLYTQLFSETPLYLDQIKIDIVEKLCEMKVDDWRKVNWPKATMSFPGFSTNTIRALFKTLARFNCPRRLYSNLPAVLNHLQVIFIPQLKLRKGFNRHYISRLKIGDDFTLHEYK